MMQNSTKLEDAAERVQGAASGILSYFTRHRTAANLLLVLMLGAGLLALPQMRSQFFPDIVIENVSVSVAWNGAGAEDVDASIVQVLEPALLAVEGVTESSARSREGSATLTLEFEPGWDIQRGADDIDAAIDAVTELPDDVEEPVVRWGGWNDTVTDVIVTGPVGLEQLAGFADELVVRLFREGVTRTSISGVAAPETLVEVKTIDLIRHDISMSEIAAAIRAESDATPAGDVGNGAARVRTGVAKRSAEQIAAVVLRSNEDGSKLTVGDVAAVRVEGVDRDRAYFVGQEAALTVTVNRSAKGDAIGIQNTVQDVSDDMELTLPQGVSLELVRTRAEAIKARLDLLIENGVMGLGLVGLLLFLFLNARTALMVAAGIPVAMLTAIALMYAVGLSINMISLFALIITLGIVVDDAIVVGEHADFRVRNLGEEPVVAAENAARRMFAPVFSSTITTIIAFFALTSISGRFGDLLSAIPFVVIVVLIASLAECFLILPNHLSHSIGMTGARKWYDWPSYQVDKGFRFVRDRLFSPLISLIVKLRYPVVALGIFLLSWQTSSLVSGDVPWRFFTPPERATLSGNFAMAAGATRENSFEMMREMQRAAKQVGEDYEEKYGRNPVIYVIAQVGGGSGRGLSGVDTKESFQLGGLYVELIEADLRPYPTSAFTKDLQRAVVNHPQAETVSFRGGRFGPGGDSVDIQLYGADIVTLKSASENLKTTLAQYAEISALEDNLAYDKDELILELTAQGKALGFTIDGLSETLSDRLGGIEAATFPDGGRTATVTVQLPDGELTSDFLDRTTMRTDSGQYVPLADIVSVQRQTGFSTVRRENGVKLVTVSGEVSEDDPARAAEIQLEMETTILPELEEQFGVTYRLSGLSEQENEFLQDALFGLMAALIGIYLTLSWIFSSWLRPIVVMVIIPFGLIGAIYGHAVWGVPFTMFSVVGLIGMTGIIINDSIVLVSTIDEYAQERGLIPAVIDATTDRLRPVMLTTLTTVLGLAPLLYEQSVQAQFLKPTVITLVYGLGFGMIVVLIMVPAVLAMQMDVGRQVSVLRYALRSPQRFGASGMAVVLGTVMASVWFAVTVGAVIVKGALPQILGAGQMMNALMMFLGGILGLFALIYICFGVARLIIKARATP